MKQIPPPTSIALAILSFALASLPAFDLILRGDQTGQLIYSAVWVLVGFAWIGQLLRAKKTRTQ